MITKLAEKWRKKHTYFADICADELEAALPTWTRITDDTVVESDGLYLVTSKRHDGKWRHPQVVSGWVLDIGDMCRPLCDLDYPPEQQS